MPETEPGVTPSRTANAFVVAAVPARAIEAAHERLELEGREPRSGRPRFMGLIELATALRAGYAEVMGATGEEVALTGSTTDGVNTALSALDLRPGEEILTTDEE